MRAYPCARDRDDSGLADDIAPATETVPACGEHGDDVAELVPVKSRKWLEGAGPETIALSESSVVT